MFIDVHTPRALTIEETEALTIEEIMSLRALGFLPAMAGGDPEGDGDGDGDGDGNGNGDGDGDGDGGDGDGDGDGDGSPDDVLEINRGDYERLRTIARQHDVAERKRKQEEAERLRQQQISEGRFDEALKEAHEERDTAARERDEANNLLTQERRDRRIGDIAKRLGFKDSGDAMAFVRPEDGDDDAAAERALKKLARNKPYLVESRRATGLPVGGGAGGSILTIEQIRQMTPEEINANWTDVQKVMQASGSGAS